VSSTASFTALAIFNPGKFAALFAGVSQIVPNASKTVRTGATLFNSFGPLNVGGTPILATILKIKQLASNITSGTFSVSLPEFDVVIEMSSNLVSQFTKTISSANSRIRYLINQSLTNNVQMISNSANSRIRFVNATINSSSSLTASLTMSVTQLLSISEPTEAGSGSRFGHQVAIDGNNIIISDPGLPVTNSGRAFIFNATTGGLVRTINNPNSFGTINNDEFGHSVDIAGNFAVIGAWTEDGSNSSFKGAAYVFNLSTGALVQTVTNLNNANDYYFGYSVATDGTNFAVGQQRDGVRVYPNVPGSGSTYSISDQTTNERFHIVDISGDNLVIGSQRVTANFTDTYKVYQRSLSAGGGIVRTFDNPNPASTEHDDFFGSALSIFGNFLLVGARGEDAPFVSFGRAYLYNLTTGALVHTFVNPGGTNDFGKSVALGNRYAVISSFNQFHIFNILTGDREATIGLTNASDISISGNKIVVSTGPGDAVRVFGF
jgi:hypothetical protein